jgi:von Willebrand factor type A domain
MSLRKLPLSVGLAAVAAAALSMSAMHASAGVNKSLFVGVTDESGKPVTNLTADDILIREDQADRPVKEVKPATQPISVVFLVDTSMDTRIKDAYGTPDEWIRDIRLASAAFARELLNKSPDAAIELMEFGQAAVTVTPFTQNFEEYQKGVNHLVSKPGAASVLMEAIQQANRDLAKRPSPRRAIVELNLEPSNEQSQMDEKGTQDAFRKSTAQFWGLSVQRGAYKQVARDVMLNNIAKITGGERQFIVGISASQDILKQYADVLASQFEVVYDRPENKSAKVIQVGARGGLKLHASAFPPQ